MAIGSPKRPGRPVEFLTWSPKAQARVDLGHFCAQTPGKLPPGPQKPRISSDCAASRGLPCSSPGRVTAQMSLASRPSRRISEKSARQAVNRPRCDRHQALPGPRSRPRGRACAYGHSEQLQGKIENVFYPPAAADPSKRASAPAGPGPNGLVPYAMCLGGNDPWRLGHIYPAVTPARPLSGDLAPRVGVGGAFPARSTPVRRVRRRSCPPPRMACGQAWKPSRGEFHFGFLLPANTPTCLRCSSWVPGCVPTQRSTYEKREDQSVARASGSRTFLGPT